MDLSNINPILLVASIMISATPILLAAIGEMVVEKSGVLNLGVEGMMITGAVIGFIVAINSGSPLLGFATAAVAGAALSVAFGVLTQIFLSNQVATGLGLTLVGLGLSSLLLPFLAIDAVTVALLYVVDPTALVAPLSTDLPDLLLPMMLELAFVMCAFPLVSLLVGRRIRLVQAKAREVLDEASRRYAGKKLPGW